MIARADNNIYEVRRARDTVTGNGLGDDLLEGASELPTDVHGKVTGGCRILCRRAFGLTNELREMIWLASPLVGALSALGSAWR
jgi:hypothetical protein